MKEACIFYLTFDTTENKGSKDAGCLLKLDSEAVFPDNPAFGFCTNPCTESTVDAMHKEDTILELNFIFLQAKLLLDFSKMKLQ